MAPTAESVKQLRWSQEEIDILVQMTNDQLELERQDKSMVISWIQHWKKVSSRLKEHGYSRSPTACRGTWKRGVEAQRTIREAAGPEWEDTEHEILVDMTRKQLELENSDPSAVIPWAKHWKKVSLRLAEEGFEKSPDNCDAYWQLIQSGEEAVSEMEGDDRSPEVEEDVPTPDLAVTSPQVSKNTIWSLEEYENLLSLLKARRDLEEKNELEPLEGKKFWLDIAQSHRGSGYDRTFEACKTFWNKQGRERSGFDERAKYTDPGAGQSSTTKSNIVELKPSRASSWSMVNGAVEEPVDTSRNLAIEVLRKLQKEHSTEAPDPVSDSKLNSTLGMADSDHELDNNPTQPEKKQRKKGVTNFRLTPEQRAVLEAEVAKNDIISSQRKQDLAQDLDLEYKTVRNWFTNYNVKARRSQGTIPIIPTEKLMTEDFDESFYESRPHSADKQNNMTVTTSTPGNEVADVDASVRQAGSKRPHSVGHDEIVHNGPSPKNRLPAYERHLQRAFSPNREQPKLNSGFNPVNGISSRQIPVIEQYSFHQPRIGLPSAASRHNGIDVSANSPSPAIKSSPSVPPLAQSNKPRTPLPSTNSRPSGKGIIFNDRNSSPHINEALSQPREQALVRERTIGNGTANPQEPVMEPRNPPSVYTSPPAMDRFNDSMGSSIPRSSVVHSFNAPNLERATQSQVSRNKTDNRINPMPASTVVHHTSLQHLNGQQEPSIPPKTAATPTKPVPPSPPANEDPKALAYRTVQSFSSDIERLKQAYDVRKTNITKISSQLANFAYRRSEIDQAKQDEIARTVQGIEKRYESEYTALRQQETWLQHSRDTEAAGLNTTALELSKKEKGLIRWQGIVEYYDNEGGDH